MARSIIQSTSASSQEASTSAECARCPHLEDHGLSDPRKLGSSRRTMEGVLAGVPEGSEAGVGKDASVVMDSTSTSGDASTGVALLLYASSRVYSASMRRISVEDVGVTSMSSSRHEQLHPIDITL
uniref:Uncharacterized protein n=1 Tax=Solanum tuberosum TaxID=4113 RepID=M1D8P8_SOLTU